jgi:hypothetical protein
MRRTRRRSGQVVVEMILILPVFLGIIFSIMEIGNVSFRLIVLNHATYEVARVGGMTWLMPSGGPSKLSTLMASILPQATVSCWTENTLRDPQADLQNMDLVCTGSENVRLIFPISSIILASKGAPPGTRALHATVRMPIEQPLAQ